MPKFPLFYFLCLMEFINGVITFINRVIHRVIFRKWLFFQIKQGFLRLPINSYFSPSITLSPRHLFFFSAALYAPTQTLGFKPLFRRESKRQVSYFPYSQQISNHSIQGLYWHDSRWLQIIMHDLECIQALFRVLIYYEFS